MSSLHRRLDDLFNRAMDLPPAERDALVDGCEDAELRAALVSALAEADEPTPFLETPLTGLISGAVETPDVIGRYRLLELLGAGGMGRVYLAEQERPRRRVALKLAHESELTDEGALRFAREAELLGRLDHPGVARVHEAGTQATPSGRFAFIAMEYIDGKPLVTDVARSTLDAIAIVENLARALAACHDADIVHRDVKPANIMVRGDGRVVLVDFGIARELLDDGPAMTRTGSFLGTPAYMSPEQIRGDHVDARSDVWSAGVILHELVTGKRPFDHPTHAGLIDAILRTPPAPVAASAGGRELRAVLATCLAKEPDTRYSTAGALADDLARIRRGEPVSVREPGLAARAANWTRRNPRLSLALASSLLLGLVAATALGFLASRWGDIQSGRAAEVARRTEQVLEKAWMDFTDGRRTTARENLEAALEARDVDAASRAALARALNAMIELETPGTVSAAASEDPAFASYVRGVRLLVRGRANDPGAFEEARLAFENAIVHAEAPRALHHIGRLWALKATGTVEEIEAAVDFIDARFPHSPTAGAATAGAFLELRPETAVQRYRRALERYPGDPTLTEGLAHALMHAGRLPEATELARELVERRPDVPQFKTMLANFIHIERPTAEALELARAGLAGRAENVDALSILAGIERAMGLRSEALAHYREAARLAPHRRLTLHKIATMEREAGNHVESERFFARACAIPPVTAAMFADHGGVLLALGRLHEAIAACGKALEIDPRSRAALLNGASAMQIAGRPHSAIAHARRALEVDATCAEAWLVIGLCASELHRHEEAVQALEKADAVGRARGPWPHPTPSMIARGRRNLGTPPPRWLALAEAAARHLDAGRPTDGAATLDTLVDHLEIELDEDRCEESVLLRRLNVLADDPRLTLLEDDAALGRLDVATETRLRRVRRGLAELSAEVAGD